MRRIWCLMIALGAVMGLALETSAEEAKPEEPRLGERVYMPGFSIQAPAGWEGPEVKRKRPVTFVSWRDTGSTSDGRALFQLAVTDIDAAPQWIGYDKMTIGELTDHFVKEIAQRTVGLETSGMKELKISGSKFRKVDLTFQSKNNAMQLVPMRGFIMAMRNEKFLYTITAQDVAKNATQILPLATAAAESFRWDVEPADPLIPAALPLDEKDKEKSNHE